MRVLTILLFVQMLNSSNGENTSNAKWYPVYGNDFNQGSCSSASPVPNGIISFDSQLECCQRAFAGQSSGACLFSLPISTIERLKVEWHPFYNDHTCVSTKTSPRPHGVPGYETQLECCIAEYRHGRDECFASMPNPPTISPTPAGGAELGFYYADYSHGWNGGSCSNKGPAPIDCVQYVGGNAALDCCEKAFSGQSSGNCIKTLPDEIKATLDVEWYPVYSNQICTIDYKQGNSKVGIVGYTTQLQCCLAEFRHGTSACLQGLPNPPTVSPTPVGGKELDVWYADYIRGWNNGVCVNRSPIPNGIISYDGPLQCCQRAYAGQSSGVCISSLPSSIRESLKTLELDVWYPDYKRGWNNGVCVNRGPLPNGIMTYDSQDRCCQNAYAGQSSRVCLVDSSSIAAAMESIVTPTTPPSPPPQDLSRRKLAEQIDMLFDANSRTSSANNNDREVEESFGNVDDVDEIITTKYDDKQIDSSIGAGDQSLDEASVSRSQLLGKLDKIFDSKNHDLVAHDRRRLRSMLEDALGDVQDLEEVIMNAHDDSISLQSSIDDKDPDEDYYSALPDFVTVDLNDSFQCKCVACEKDRVCGHLWKGTDIRGSINDSTQAFIDKTLNTHVVISFATCKRDLHWVSDYIQGFDTVSIDIISRCGQDIVGAPLNATVQVLPGNGGSHDHSFAHFITSVLPTRVGEDDDHESIVIFMTDDIMSKEDGLQSSLDLVRISAVGDQGFACGSQPSNIKYGQHSFDLSIYHETETLRQFTTDGSRDHNGQAKTLGSWWDTIGVEQVRFDEAVPVCYGGLFSTNLRNIMRVKRSLWKQIENSLGNDSGHERQFAERSWAPLLSTPLQPYQLEALLDKADGVYMSESTYHGHHGALIHRPKIYIHIGMEGTSSTELLTESLVEKIELLKLDGYRVAVHGKYAGGEHGFPNIDRLGSCLWNEQDKSLIPKRMAEVTHCNKHLLPDLSRYLLHAVEKSHDVIMLNPWLTFPGSSHGLSIYLDDAFDASIVVYYRRFFEWISIKYQNWRRDLFDTSLTPDISKLPLSSFQYIDFLREYCKQLFYGKNVNEDGFPVASHHRYVVDEEDSPMQIELSESDYDPTTNFDLEQLTGLQDYVYFVAKQYHSQPRFRRGIKIVNYHDKHGVETNFYCRVLHDAPNSCNDAAHQEHEKTSNSTVDEGSVLMSLPAILTPSNALEDIVIKAFSGGRLSFDASQPREKFMDQVLLWTEMIAIALHEKGIPIEQLPMECLYKFERIRLLEVSLAYERDLLPDFFASHKGAQDLKNEFENQSFCSVDPDAILSDPQWDFLFYETAKYALSRQQKAFIHIGAPRTGGELLQQSLAKDKDVLREDNIFTLAATDVHLAPCLWSDAERQLVAVGDDRDMPNCEQLFTDIDQLQAKSALSGGDIAISDELFSETSSETGLLEAIGNGFEPVIVIYYRRFFDWILSSYYHLHLAVSNKSLESMPDCVRLVDFIRQMCKSLFEYEIDHADQQLVDLVDLPEYTYQLLKQYSKIPEYQDDIKIVNFHDGPATQSFYCDVLNAKKACEMESERLGGNAMSIESSTTNTVSKYAEIAMELKKMNTISSPTDQVHLIANELKDKMAQRGLTDNDLPKECLTTAEVSLLLKVSLAYERALLPNTPEEEIRRQFAILLAEDAFCSVSLDRMINSISWQFLFDGLELESR